MANFADRNGRKRGFTLVELIVVLVILAILAALLIPALTGYIDRAQQQALISKCRSAVLAAQILATESYAQAGTASVDVEEVRELAEVPGTVSVKAEDLVEASVEHLSYKDELTVVYCRHPEDCDDHDKTYNFVVYDSWEEGAAYQMGAVVDVGGIIFQCYNSFTESYQVAHNTPGTAARTKNFWRVIGYSGDVQGYSSSYRYTEGVLVTQGGKTYKRTAFDISNDMAPPQTDYWTPVD